MLAHDDEVLKRPIPPPFSREGVLRQFRDFNPTTIDNADYGEVILVASCKRPLDGVIVEDAAREASVGASAMKKRRLVLSLHAHRTANDTAHRATRAGSAQNYVKHTVTSTAFECTTLDEEECTASTRDPDSPEQLEGDLDDDVAAQELARIHSLVTKELSGSPEMEAENEWISMSGRRVVDRSAADERYQTEKENQYALRSRQLREERLRQSCEVEDPIVGETVANDASESIEAPAQSFSEAILSSISEPQTDSVPNDWCADPESSGEQTDSETPGDENFDWYECPPKAGTARNRPRALPNPASRQAAERYRTQGRHLETGAFDHGLQRRQAVNEDSLLAAKSGRTMPVSQGGPQSVLGHVPVQFSRPSDSRLENDSGQTLSPAAQALAAKWRKQTAEASLSVPVGEIASDVDRSDDTAMKNERARLKSLGTVVNNLNLAYIHLSLIRLSGKLFAEREQEIHRNLLREGIKLMKMGVPHNVVHGEISRLKDQSRRTLPGEMLTYKMSTIDKVYEDVKAHYHELCGAEHAEKIQTALRKIPESMATIDEWLEALYRRGVEERARNRARKRVGGDQPRVRFASADEVYRSDDIARNVRTQQPKAKKLSKIQRIRGRLALFEEAEKEREAEKQSREQRPLSSTVQDQESSEESEEDADGEGYYGAAQRPSSGFGSQLPPAFAQSESLEIEQEQESPEAPDLTEAEVSVGPQPASVQSFDERLAYQNKLNALDHQSRGCRLREDLDDLDSSASVSDETESSDEDDRQAYRYSVRANFRGIAGYEDDWDYSFGSFFQRKKAEARMWHIVTEIRKQQHEEYGHTCDIVTQIRNDMVVSIALEMPDGNTTIVRMSQTIVDLTKRQAKQARNMIPQHVGHQWIVHWQKDIITTTTTTVTRLAQPSCDLTKDVADMRDNDSLFGGTPPPQSAGTSFSSSVSTQAATETVIDINTDVEHKTYCPKPEEQDFYTNSYHANVRAKEIYIDWYASFCPEHERPSDRYLEYSGMLGQEEAARRAELEGVADLPGAVVGPWEAEFERPEEETVEEGQEVGVVKMVKKVKVKEHMVVRVVQNSVKGPRN
ncbi:uncharacterized protein AB675_5056 [Cyphellophora attinorum]|uniref:Uncharacterized protein n=1 Tax=Cyphellophora attinorum TaxID=1664694 RepID=A0A0N0NLV2_9EURO|nr:uncharacterized protein AB675_5056 [Phialophora attinorum]KPI39469.1 hypothetical protein AB675_5056 [Phialophora attinorum]